MVGKFYLCANCDKNPMKNQTITAIEGIDVGHAHNLDGPTGCTVVLCPPGTVAGVDQRGGAPGTRETDLLKPMHLVQHVDAILLSGGSAFGLAAADGVMRFLEEHGRGFPVGVHGFVPIVPAAIIFDLDVGDSRIRPDAEMGYAACHNASSDPVAQGSVGAGAGARCGMALGPDHGVKAGIGSAIVEISGGILIGALIVVNALGDVIDSDGTILAGARTPDGPGFVGTMQLMTQIATRSIRDDEMPGNTVIGVVATNASLSKEGANKVAQMAHDGLARAINPAHTLFDGDTIFALATGEKEEGNINVIGAFAAEVTEQAIRNAVQQATTLGDMPAISNLTGGE